MLPKRLGDICASAFLEAVKNPTRKRCKSVGADSRPNKEAEEAHAQAHAQAQAQVDRLTWLNESLQAQNARLIKENAELAQALVRAKEEASMAKDIAWKFKGRPPDDGQVLVTYANLVLERASAAIRTENDSQPDTSESESECESDEGQEDVPPTIKKARTKIDGKAVVQRVRFGEECKDLISSFKAEMVRKEDDVKLLEAVLTAQAAQTFSRFSAYDVDFQTQWRNFSEQKTLFTSFRQYYFKHRAASKKI